MRAADALEFPFLQHAQELDLRVERQLAHFIHEQRALVRELEPADATLNGARERAFLMAEQLALPDPLRDRATVDLDERTILAIALVVQCTRDQFLSRPRFAREQHRRLDARDLSHLAQHRAQRFALAHDVTEVDIGANLVLQILVLDLETVLVALNVGEQLRALDRHRRLVGEDA